MSSLDDLLLRAGMTAADLPETIDECDAALQLLGVEIGEIRDQIEAEKAGVSDFGFRRQGWAGAAIHALGARRARYGALRRHRNRMRDAAEAANRQAAAAAKADRLARAEADSLAADARRQRRAATHAERMKSESEVLLAAMRRHVATLAPEIRDGFYAAMNEAQAALRERRDA